MRKQLFILFSITIIFKNINSDDKNNIKSLLTGMTAGYSTGYVLHTSKNVQSYWIRSGLGILTALATFRAIKNKDEIAALDLITCILTSAILLETNYFTKNAQNNNA